MGRLIAFFLFTFTAAALADDDHERARRLADTGDILPLAEILRRADDHWQGRIIEVELEHEEGLYLYELEVLTPQGQVVELYFDAGTGELVKTEADD